uniref:Uncharacterized protein n=1 Tax=Cucumis melo TaxID=3656 RepID=A0A9I9D5F6_CUCME
MGKQEKHTKAGMVVPENKGREEAPSKDFAKENREEEWKFWIEAEAELRCFCSKFK